MFIALSFVITVAVIYAVIPPPEAPAEPELRNCRPREDGHVAGQLIALDRAIRRFEPARARHTQPAREREPEELLKTAG